MKGSEDPAPLSVMRPRKLDVKNLQLVMCWGAHWTPSDYELWVRLSYIVGSRPPRNRVRLCLKIIINSLINLKGWESLEGIPKMQDASVITKWPVG